MQARHQGRGIGAARLHRAHGVDTADHPAFPVGSCPDQDFGGAVGGQLGQDQADGPAIGHVA